MSAKYRDGREAKVKDRVFFKNSAGKLDTGEVCGLQSDGIIIRQATGETKVPAGEAIHIDDHNAMPEAPAPVDPAPDAVPTREIGTHKVNEANDAIDILVMDEPGAGGANHEYLLVLRSPAGPVLRATPISFQNGPIREAGVNGLTQEALLAVVIDRLECFQAGPYKCKENEDALSMIKGGLTCLMKRTRRRVTEGTEGTHALDAQQQQEQQQQ